jgi:hypothetical protein
MRCCVGCFGDGFLRGLIAREGSAGACGCCGARGAPTVPASRLRKLWTPLLELYPVVSDPTAGHLAEAVQEDWPTLFASGLTQTHMRALVDAIIPAASTWSCVGLSRGPLQRDAEEAWQAFSDHIRRERRFVPDGATLDRAGIPLLTVGRAPGRSIVLAKEDLVWRARIDDRRPPMDTKPHKRWLGSPPPEVAPAGRASTAGIPVFYGASDAKTAAAETRPTRGDRVWVADWRPDAALTLLDLATPQLPPSPFNRPDLLAEARLTLSLRQVGAAFAAPVRACDAVVDYTPTQYVSESIRSAGYDGFYFGSAQWEDGRNIVIFDPARLARGRRLEQITVLGVGWTVNARDRSSSKPPSAAQSPEEWLPSAGRGVAG